MLDVDDIYRQKTYKEGDSKSTSFWYYFCQVNEINKLKRCKPARCLSVTSLRVVGGPP
uniref:Uncharacterized protein n=1 Tax=Arundo donax TaxID=35708 RepID=A0A0A9MPL3_ARUDO